jgi:hypothetical protein
MDVMEENYEFVFCKEVKFHVIKLESGALIPVR